MVIGFLQLNSTIGDFAANRKKLLAGYEKAVALGAEFVLAPELFLCGYPPRDLLLRADFIDANLAALEDAAKKIGAVPLCVGFVDKNPERPGRALRNAAAVLQNGIIIWRTSQMPCCRLTMFLTKTVISSRRKKSRRSTFKDKKLGITICEDIWNDEDFWPERFTAATRSRS